MEIDKINDELKSSSESEIYMLQEMGNWSKI
jgi:hypothetical protein